jgi:hypothetical protein
LQTDPIQQAIFVDAKFGKAFYKTPKINESELQKDEQAKLASRLIKQAKELPLFNTPRIVHIDDEILYKPHQNVWKRGLL